MKSKTLIAAAVFAVAALGAAAVPTAALALADKPEGPWRKSASYVRVLDMLGPILTKHYPTPIFDGSIMI